VISTSATWKYWPRRAPERCHKLPDAPLTRYRTHHSEQSVAWQIYYRTNLLQDTLLQDTTGHIIQNCQWPGKFTA